MSGSELRYCDQCHPKRISVPSEGECFDIDLHEIWLLEADRAYTHVHLTDGSRYIHCHNLKWHEERLPTCFARPERSFIINMHYMKGTGPDGVIRMRHAFGENIYVKGNHAERFWERRKRWLIGEKQAETAPRKEEPCLCNKKQPLRIVANGSPIPSAQLCIRVLYLRDRRRDTGKKPLSLTAKRSSQKTKKQRLRK